MSAASSALPSSRSRWRSWLLPWLLPVILVIGTGLLVFLTILNQPLENERRYDLDSAGPIGLRALRLWLAEMGYIVTQVRENAFALPENVDLLLVYPGGEEWSRTDMLALRRWIRAGGTAALIAMQSEGLMDFLLPGSYLNSVQSSSNGGIPVRQMQPLLPASPSVWENSIGSYDLHLHGVGDVVPLLSSQVFDGGESLGVQRVGAGIVWYASDFHALTNTNLQDRRQTAVMAAMLRTVPDGGTIAFDGYHLYGPAPAGDAVDAHQLVTLQDWLYRTAGGRALLFAVAVGALYWVLAGRRLGPPLPAQRELRRREGAEYVRAMAGLKRRAQASDEVAQHQRQRLKIALGRPRHIAATLSDADFMQALRVTGDLRPEELDAIQTLLARLLNPRNEQELVSVAAAVDGFLDKS